MSSEEYIPIPRKVWESLCESAGEKNLENDEYFKVMGIIRSIEKKNEDSVFLKPKALEYFSKIYDSETRLPF